MNNALGYSMLIVREALALYVTPMGILGVRDELQRRHGFGPSHQTIAIWVRAAGIARTPAESRAMAVRTMWQKDHDAIRTEARRLIYEESYTRNAAAMKLGVGAHTLRSLIPADECPTRSEAVASGWWQRNDEKTNKRRERRDRVLSMRESGSSYQQIADATGLCTGTVRRYLHDAGMTKVAA